MKGFESFVKGFGVVNGFYGFVKVFNLLLRFVKVLSRGLKVL